MIAFLLNDSLLLVLTQLDKTKSSIYFNKPPKSIPCGQAMRYGAWGECGL